jgi:hypothetical protein
MYKHSTHTFEDISILHSGRCSCKNFIQEFKLALNPQIHTEIIRWETTTLKGVQLANNETNIKKTDDSTWIQPICSAKAIEKTTYFEVKILELGINPNSSFDSVGKIIIGFTQTKKRYLDQDAMVVIRNDKTCHNIDVIQYGSCEAGTGDVLGFVVDFEHDRFLFYINTKLVAEGKLKPSKLEPIYFILWFHNENCELEMGHFFPYRMLERYRDSTRK